MKLSEFINGDWVSYKANNHYKVAETLSDKIVITAGGGRWHVELKYCEPIPLTADILEKNGFERCATAPSFWLVGDLYYGTLLGISEDSYEDTWHVSTFKDHNDNDWVLFKVCYVHELQHILKLLDIDKEIEL